MDEDRPREQLIAELTQLRQRVVELEAAEAARVRLQEAAKECSNLLRAVVEGTSDAIYVKDLEGRYLMVNSTAAGLLGKRVDEIIGEADTDLFPPHTARAMRETDHSTLTSREARIFEEIATIGKVDRTYLSTKGVYYDGQGNVKGVFGISRDITEIERQQQTLRESEKRFRDLYENAPNAYFSVVVDGRINKCNSRAGELLG